MIKDIKAQNENVKPTDSVMAKLHADFPQCFSKDCKFDIDKFQNLIQPETDITREGYDLNFLGKNYANLIACTETETVIQPDLEHNAQPENANSQNVYISGDNLDALKHLLKSYSGRVKCIYIDPPYNTGSDGFVYNDKFNFTSEQLQTKLGVSEEKAKRILDLCTRGSASHSAWLMFMAPRLMLARDLLTEDGVIFISIDDNEQANLKLLCDSVFGEDNLVSQLVWEQGKKSMAAQIAVNHEYCLCYNKRRQSNIDRKKREENNNWVTRKLGLEPIYAEYERLKDIYHNDFNEIEKGMSAFYDSLKEDNPSKAHKHYCKVDSNGLFFPDNISQGTGKGGTFDIIHPITNKPCKLPSGGWRFSENNLPSFLEEGRIVFGEDHTTVPCLKRYLKETEYNVFASVFYKDGRGASKRLETLLGAKVFDNPKDTETIKTLVQIATSDNDKEQIVVDFFSGSGTTAESVMSLATEQTKKYQYIAVQLPEDIDASYEKASSDDKKDLKRVIDFLNDNHYQHTLDYVGYERIRRAASKIKSDIHNDIAQLEKQLKTKEEKLAKANKQKSLFDTGSLLVKEIETLKTAIENKRKALETTDFGFKHYTLQDVDKNTLDRMDKFDANGLLSDEDILQKFGKETVLETWCVKDGYGFGANVVELQLAKYTAYHCGSHLYFVSGECFDENAVIALIDKYNSEPSFNPQNIVLFGYSFTFTQTEMLRKNLNTLKDSFKNLNINIDVRY
ncbi:MAG: site-specific DNA-methyltransferase [Salinivirgaceae bacterium]|nr:site-specific DNA-methyltransferase [Salinivirgaceae bacterium]